MSYVSVYLEGFQEPSIYGCFGRTLHLFGSHLEGTLEAVWKVPWKLDGQYIRSCLESALKAVWMNSLIKGCDNNEDLTSASKSHRSVSALSYVYQQQVRLI